MSISKILVANRGEIASRVIRTCREMGIATVAVHSDDDAFAPYVADADESVHLPGSRSADTYLRADLVVEAARRTGADAVHPGYGFLSENAGFAEACQAAGITFIGPTPDAIRSMGDKLRSKELMGAAGVPILRSVRLDDATVDRATAEDVAGIGYPVLVKASAGGGGRGMRVVLAPEHLQEAVDSARREAASAFSDDTVFVEKYVVDPRHVEVQVMADEHDNVVALFERECSIQRRHQKVLEEAPSPVVDEDLRRRLCDAAVEAARAVTYRGAGTVEFVLAPDGSFAFLEMNTRLQVEHPVTELVTGLDLVRLQIEVAAGRPLPSEALAPRLHGHAIEARLYAEDVAAGYLPTSGTLTRLDWPADPGLRIDAGVVGGSHVPPHYDPMLAKVVMWAPTRDEAVSRLASALRRTRIAGLTTNRDLLVQVLEHDAFRRAEFSTSFLDDCDVESLPSLVAPEDAAGHLAAAAVVLDHVDRAGVAVQQSIPTGWRNNRSAPASRVFDHRGEQVAVQHVLAEDRTLTVRVGDGPELRGRVWDLASDSVDLDLDGVRRRYGVDAAHGRVAVSSPRGSVTVTAVERFPDESRVAPPGALTAAMPGTVVAVHAKVDDEVVAGAPLVVLEAMKMEHSVLAPESGRVAEIVVGAGEQVEAGALLARIEPAESDV
ncbi:biotin carboxylase N-terminal domain-containing protein [Pseudonocardia sp. McavD-2-B]|uniref:acetyl/propionyl/methylcrotonyl-CoA carboxylase subunit alpha n=1 Tax=Pseudonocardia sp. McavD-2-B TaxID=2954499 RepID=UPI0020976FC9|nr:biotin carboxylase N-terminal domain-containing protein [Pseudonocardia sp. McavD-2-B]MCO7191507.1 ATP-grasp domain-containing protein [Pseudonocardia sp. McavD-2-B]